MGFRVLALVAPEPGEAGRCPQLEQLRALPLGNGDGLTVVPLRPRSVAGGIQQIARRLMQQLDFKVALVGGLDDPRSLSEAVLLFREPPRAWSGRRRATRTTSVYLQRFQKRAVPPAPA